MLKLAQINFDELQSELPDFKFWDSTLGEIIGALIPYVMAIAGLLLLVYLIFGGFTLMISQSDPKKAQMAKTRLTNAAIGFIIVFTAYWAVQLIGEVLGIEEIQNVFSG